MISAANFRKKIYAYYKKNRRDLPWRRTRDPYKILVSEVMLQQTQVDRVVPFYKNWLKLFPNVRALARASTSNVLAAWSGLGYNRRAINLQRAAQQIVTMHKGKFPKSVDALDELPGVGRYTAGAVAAFAWDIPGAYIETNIRSVYLHFFFPNRGEVSDRQLMPVIEETMDKKNPRDWYYALMDYGSMLKKKVPNPSRRSKHHARQSKFKGSNRELRGAILKSLLKERTLTPSKIASSSGRTKAETARILGSLSREGFIKKKGSSYTLT
jgi:A/G-specific adenine glycosylase